jgi:hypothetical protein
VLPAIYLLAGRAITHMKVRKIKRSESQEDREDPEETKS